MRRTGVIVCMAAVLAGCGASPSASPSPSVEPLAVYIVNVDGPAVDLLLDEQVIASVECGATATLVPGAGGIPELPWELTVRSSDGAVLGTPSVDGPLPQGLLIRGTSVLGGPWPMSYGPAPGPCAP